LAAINPNTVPIAKAAKIEELLVKAREGDGVEKEEKN
jgi:hypothetical protein